MQTESIMHAVGGQYGPAAHTYPSRADVQEIADQLRELYRSRKGIIKSELSLLHQMRCVALRILGLPPKSGHGPAQKLVKAYQQYAKGKDDAPSPEVVLLMGTEVPTLNRCLAILQEDRADVEKRMCPLAEQLPIWTGYCQHFKGFGPQSLANIVGEVGRIGKYRHWRCLWKRLGVAVIDGERQRRVRDKELAKLHGYCPRRRSMLWNIGEPIVKCRMPIYRDIYDAEKARITAREEGKTQAWSKAHINNHAKRIATKALAKDLWLAWRDLERGIELEPLKRPVHRDSDDNAIH